MFVEILETALGTHRAAPPPWLLLCPLIPIGTGLGPHTWPRQGEEWGVRGAPLLVPTPCAAVLTQSLVLARAAQRKLSAGQEAISQVR